MSEGYQNLDIEPSPSRPILPLRLLDDLADFVTRHRPCGGLTGDATELCAAAASGPAKAPASEVSRKRSRRALGGERLSRAVVWLARSAYSLRRRKDERHHAWAAEDAWPAKGASSDQRYRPRGSSVGPAPRRLQPELLVPAGRGAGGRAQQDTGSVFRRRGDCPGQDRDRQGLCPGGSLRPPPISPQQRGRVCWR